MRTIKRKIIIGWIVFFISLVLLCGTIGVASDAITSFKDGVQNWFSELGDALAHLFGIENGYDHLSLTEVIKAVEESDFSDKQLANMHIDRDTFLYLLNKVNDYNNRSNAIPVSVEVHHKYYDYDDDAYFTDEVKDNLNALLTSGDLEAYLRYAEEIEQSRWIEDTDFIDVTLYDNFIYSYPLDWQIIYLFSLYNALSNGADFNYNIPTPKPEDTSSNSKGEEGTKEEPKEPKEIPAGTEVSLNELFEVAAQKYGIPLNLLKAVAYTESGFRPDATSHCGAMGIMQLMPATARGLGVTDPYDPAQNIDGGAKYIAQKLKEWNGDVVLALASYNAGSGNVRKYGGVPPFKETQDYVRKITNLMNMELDADRKVIVGASSSSIYAYDYGGFASDWKVTRYNIDTVFSFLEPDFVYSFHPSKGDKINLNDIPNYEFLQSIDVMKKDIEGLHDEYFYGSVPVIIADSVKTIYNKNEFNCSMNGNELQYTTSSWDYLSLLDSAGRNLCRGFVYDIFISQLRDLPGGDALADKIEKYNEERKE